MPPPAMTTCTSATAQNTMVKVFTRSAGWVEWKGKGVVLDNGDLAVVSDSEELVALILKQDILGEWYED